MESKYQSLVRYIKNRIPFTENEATLLISKTTYRKYLKGHYIIQQGDVCNHSNFIISGCTKTFYIDVKGYEHIVIFAIEDWWVSDMGSFISQTPADYNVQCLEDTEVIQFSYQNQEDLFKTIPLIETLFRKLLENALVASQKRIIAGFSLTAKEQYLQFKKKYPDIEKRVPQYMIASYLGITKEFLSKIKSQLTSM